MSAIDPISRRILQLLLADGRASYQAIADEVGLSRPAVMERVKRLEESGHILGYTARVDRARLGFPITAFVAVRYPGNELDGGESAVRSLESTMVVRVLAESPGSRNERSMRSSASSDGAATLRM